MIPRFNIYRLLGFVVLLCALSSCSDDSEQLGDKTTVTLSISTADLTSSNAGEGSRAAGGGSGTTVTATTKDNNITDLSVYIFDNKGDVIGSTYGSYTITDAHSIDVTVQTRKATGCTVYAIANVGTVVSPDVFQGMAKKAEFDAKKHVLTHASDLDSQDKVALLMFGQLPNFDTSQTSATIPMSRLASKFDFVINAGNDVDSKLPITVDSYQLCNVPKESHYCLPADLSTLDKTTMCEDETAVSLTKGASLHFTKYIYDNGVGKQAGVTDWTHRDKKEAPQNATYLKIKAHTDVWNSTYYVYLGGKALGETGNNYDYSDFTIYPNYHYTVNITISGSGHAENGQGLRVEYQAKPYYGITVTPWSQDKGKNISNPIDAQ